MTQMYLGYYFCPLRTCHVKLKTVRGIANHCLRGHPPTLDRTASHDTKDNCVCVQERPPEHLQALPYIIMTTNSTSAPSKHNSTMLHAEGLMEMEVDSDID